MTPAGIETATFRFVAQHLSHCATAVPSVCEVICQNMVERDRPQMMRGVCWMTKFTNTYSEYVILITFDSKNSYTNTLPVLFVMHMIIPWPFHHCKTSRHVDSLGLYISLLLRLFPLWGSAQAFSIVCQIPFGISCIHSFRKRTIPITFTPLCLELPETPLRQKGNVRQINNPSTVYAYQLKPAVEWACHPLQSQFTFFILVN